MSNTTAEGQTGKKIVVKGNRIGSTEKRDLSRIQVKRRDLMVEAKERRAELDMAQQFDDDKARRKYYSSNYTTDGVYSHLYPLSSCQFVADRSVVLLKL